MHFTWIGRTRAAAVAAALLCSVVTLTPSSPSWAATPAGAQVELIFAQDPNYETPVTSGSFNSNLFGLPATGAGDYAPAVNGCGARQRVAFAFTSASTNPSQAGSAERPVVSAGDSVEDLFTWPAENSEGTTMVFTMRPDYLIGPVGDQKRLDERWASGSRISMVTVCYTVTPGLDPDDPAQQQVVAGPDGYAITSWLTFTTTAAPSNPVKTSAGFVIGDVKATPSVDLVGAPGASSMTLTATLSGDQGSALTDATGNVQFHSLAGGQRTLAGSGPVQADGTATLEVPVPAEGDQTVYEATYVPDSSGSRTYNSATSRRYAVVGSPTTVVPDLVVIAEPTTYGTAARPTVRVRRAGGAASGSVAVSVDGQASETVVLSAGRAQLTLPASLGAGAHVLSAVYAGTPTTSAASGTQTLLVAPATTAMEVVAKRTSRKGKRVATLDVSLSALESPVEPRGEVQVFLKGKAVASASFTGTSPLAIKLPPLKSGHRTYLGPGGESSRKLKKKKVKVRVVFTGGPNFTSVEQTLKVRIPRKHG